MRKPLRLLGLVVAVTILLFFADGSADAVTFVVNGTADAVDVNPGNGICASASGQCTLRAAIMEANALPGADTIILPAGTYTLTIPGASEDAAATGDLDVTGDLTINGAGAASTSIDGAALDRVLHILAGTVTISGVTIRNGSPPGGSFGGGMFNAGTLTLDSSTVSGSFGPVGFAIFGGGIANSGTMTLTNSTVSSNSGFLGGGIHNSGTLTLSNTTVSTNSGIQGAGIYNSNGTLTLSHGTVSDNSVSGNPGAAGIHTTAGGSSTFRNTIVADTTSGNNCFTPGALTSIGVNLSSDASCGFPGPSLNSTNPLLGPLANNGGPTATHALLSGSPAIDAVPFASCAASTDQRGVPRPQGPGCEIGAYETAAPAACITPPSGLVGWWPMEEIAGSASFPGATSLQDIIGGNDATPFASPVGAAQGPQPVPGVVGGAMHFPKFGGSGLSGARVSPQGALATVGAANFTIDAWVNVPAAPANRLHYIVNKFDTASNRGYALYVISPGITGNERLEFKWGDGTTVSTVQTIAPMTTGQWHHVAVTFTRSATAPTLDIRLYVDGGQQGQQTGNPPGLGSLVNFVFLEIGWQPSTLDEPISIDELEIFNVALPASDVQAIFNAGSAGKCKCVTGGQSVDLTVAGTGAVFGTGSGVAATVSNPLTVNYSIQGCSGREMFLIVNAPSLPNPVYFDGSAWVPVPTPLSLITPFVIGGPATTNGSHTLFSGSLAPGTYDVFLACDLFVNGHLDAAFPPLCLGGAFDHLPLTVQ